MGPDPGVGEARRQLFAAGVVEEEERLGEEGLEELLRVADPVLDALDVGDGAQLARQAVDERLVGLDDRPLRQPHGDEEEGVGAEVVERLQVVGDDRVLPWQEVQHVGVERQPGHRHEREDDEEGRAGEDHPDVAPREERQAR